MPLSLKRLEKRLKPINYAACKNRATASHLQHADNCWIQLGSGNHPTIRRLRIAWAFGCPGYSFWAVIQAIGLYSSSRAWGSFCWGRRYHCIHLCWKYRGQPFSGEACSPWIPAWRASRAHPLVVTLIRRKSLGGLRCSRGFRLVWGFRQV